MRRSQRWADVRRDLGAALPAWAAARVAVALSLVAAHLIFHHVHPPAPPVARHLQEGLLGWDADWYLRIARVGYGRLPRVGLRFFPLLPLLARSVRPAVGGDEGLAILLVVNVAALAFAALVHRLCLVETGDAALARRATWLVSLAPPAFVLVWGYSEALAGTLAVAFFLAVRSGRWWQAGAVGVLAGLARPAGLLLVVPAAIEVARSARRVGWGERVAQAAAVAGPAAGTAAYLSFVGLRFGDPLAPLRLQQRADFRGSVTNPVVVVWDAVSDVVHGHIAGNPQHLPAAALLLVLVALTFRYWPVSYAAHAAVTVVLALSTERLGSLERYGFGAFPVLLTLACLAARDSVDRLVLSASGAAMTTYATLALLGAYVP